MDLISVGTAIFSAPHLPQQYSLLDTAPNVLSMNTECTEGENTEERRGREMEGAGIESKGSEAATGYLADWNGFQGIDFFGNQLIVSIAVTTLSFRTTAPRVHHALL